MKLLPSLKQLEYLVALDHSAHFGRAAESCYITASTLSAGIRDLEQVLGAPVAERSRRQVLMTPLGREIAARARELLQDAEEIMRLAESTHSPFSGDRRLGVIPTVAPFLLPRVLPGLQRAYPGLRIFLREDKTDALLADLRRGELDAALIALPYDIDGLDSLHLMDDPFFFACASNHALAGRDRVSPAAVAAEHLILLEQGHCLRGHALDACRVGDRETRAQYEASSLHTLVQMVAAGIGATLLPDIALRAGITRGIEIETIPLARPVSRRLTLVWRKSALKKDEYRELGAAMAAAVAAT